MSDPTTGPVVRRVEVRNAAGLHARPATILSVAVKQFEANVELVLTEVPADHHLTPGTRADAKNSIELISLGAPCGMAMDVEAHGADAEAAVAAVVHLFETGFGLDLEA